MKIFSMKPGHDGAIALVDAEQKKLLWSREPEKDSHPRYEAFNPEHFLRGAESLDHIPDVFAVSGWGKGSLALNSAVGAGYYGLRDSSIVKRKMNVFGARREYFSSSHERSHLWCAYGLSPYAQGRPCYALVWEGALGSFYLIDKDLEITHLGEVMITPGNKYAFIYALADPTFTLPKGKLRNEDPGKLMALCAYGTSGPMDVDEKFLTDFLLDRDGILNLAKDDLRHSKFYNIGLTHPDFVNFAKKYSDEIFRRFHDFAKGNLREGYPLLISGGCGLNCDWNTHWRDSGLFADVFIPPCTNDTGSAIGTAIDAMREYTGNAKVDWGVYCDEGFVDDHPDMEGVTIHPLDVDLVARALAEGAIIGWAQGRCEMGPRALGNRSILAAPFSQATRDRLNAIKRREGFRPVAPICLLEDVSEHFEWVGPSPHMLFFQRVRNDRLQAIRHVDGTARVQTVARQDNVRIHDLLTAFRAQTGVGVLCNTSLNFNGTGFINRTSDLYRYAKDNGLDGFVYGDTYARSVTRNDWQLGIPLKVLNEAACHDSRPSRTSRRNRSPAGGFGAQILYPQLPGYGSTKVLPPNEGISLDGQAQAVVAQMHEKNLWESWLLGHSVGGAIAMRVAALAPERVAGVLSVEGNFTLNDAFWCRRIAASDLASWRKEHAGMVADPEAWLARAGVDATPTTLAEARRILDYQSAETLHAVARAVVRDTGDAAFLEGIRGQLDAGLSLHLIAGERSISGWDLPSWALRAAASFATVPKVGHMLMLEKPGAFWAAVDAALGLRA